MTLASLNTPDNSRVVPKVADLAYHWTAFSAAIHAPRVWWLVHATNRPKRRSLDCALLVSVFALYTWLMLPGMGHTRDFQDALGLQPLEPI